MWFALRGLSWCAKSRSERLLILTGVKEDRLWFADPKALHHILQATSYLYVKPLIRQETASLVTDKGLLWADGTSGPH